MSGTGRKLLYSVSDYHPAEFESLETALDAAGIEARAESGPDEEY